MKRYNIIMVEKKKKKLFQFGVVMIVKNESHIIEEALASVLPMIETYSISDTGSTDDTIEKIKTFFDKHGVSGEVYSDAWKDFGYNRTLALEHASKHMKFGFMLDADDIVKYPNDLTKQKFYEQLDTENPDAYKVMIMNDTGSLNYHRTQIFNMKKPWKYEGVLHEYPYLNNGRKTDVRLLPWKVVSRRLGNRNKMDPIEKYKKDAETLSVALQKEPFNTRHMFYLAQSYRDAEEHEKAIHWYQVRVDFGGWYEEVYFSLYQIGFIFLEKLNKEKDGVYFCMKAFKFHPKRIESMHAIAHYYAVRKKDFSTAFQFINKIKNIPLPVEDGLFVSVMLYEFYALYMYYLLSFLTFHQITVSQEDWNLFPPKLHGCLQDCLQLQMIEILNDTYEKSSLEFPKDRIPINPNPLMVTQQYYRVLNPCVALDDDGNIWYNIRCTNFDVHYQSMDRNGLIQTFNYLCNSNFTKIYELTDDSVYRKQKCSKDARIIGYEDMRLFRYRHKWYFIANNDELGSYLNRPQMVLGYLKDAPNPDGRSWDIQYVVHLQFPYQQQVEKNWCPVVVPGAPTLKIVYSIHPFVVLEPDIVTGYCRILTNLEYRFQLQNIPHRHPQIRGSTPWIPFENGWLAVGHYVYFMEEMNHQRVYYHFFIYVEKDLTEIRMSNPFHFEKHVIEFATGLVAHKNNIYISYSVSDSEPRVMTIPIEDVSKRLIRL